MKILTIRKDFKRHYPIFPMYIFMQKYVYVSGIEQKSFKFKYMEHLVSSIHKLHSISIKNQ